MPENLFRVLCSCWRADVGERPSFKLLIEKMKKFAASEHLGIEEDDIRSSFLPDVSQSEFSQHHKSSTNTRPPSMLHNYNATPETDSIVQSSAPVASGHPINSRREDYSMEVKLNDRRNEYSMDVKLNDRRNEYSIDVRNSLKHSINTDSVFEELPMEDQLSEALKEIERLKKRLAQFEKKGGTYFIPEQD